LRNRRRNGRGANRRKLRWKCRPDPAEAMRLVRSKRRPKLEKALWQQACCRTVKAPSGAWRAPRRGRRFDPRLKSRRRRGSGRSGARFCRTISRSFNCFLRKERSSNTGRSVMAWPTNSSVSSVPVEFGHQAAGGTADGGALLGHGVAALNATNSGATSRTANPRRACRALTVTA